MSRSLFVLPTSFAIANPNPKIHMAQITSLGQCRWCGAALSKAAVSRHLAACAKTKSSSAPSLAGKKARGPWLHVAIEGTHDPRYWLHLAVPAEAALWDLDTVLRDIWLDCCGHASSFKIGGKYFNESPWGGAESIEEAEHMDVAIGEVLGSGNRFEYEYDFGSSTWLAGRVLADFPAVFPKRAIHLLARNDPPDFRCARCGKAAKRICAQCAWNGPGTFCDACAKEHDCGVEMLLPVVNSPRMGVCAYCGPSKEP